MPYASWTLVEKTFLLTLVLSPLVACGGEETPSSTESRRSALLVSANPPGGTYTEALEVTLDSGGVGDIYYTLDGTSPVGTDALRYEGALQISDQTLLTFTAVTESGVWSEPRKELYVVEPELVAPDPLGRVLSVDDDQIYFSAELGQEMLSQTVTVRSTGFDRVRIDRVFLSANPGSSSFFEPGRFDLVGAPTEAMYLDPGATIELTVHYYPTNILRTAAIIIDSNEEKSRDGRVIINVLGRIWDWGN